MATHSGIDGMIHKGQPMHKLSMIADNNMTEAFDFDRANAVALEQSLQNIQIMILTKLRNALFRMGLSKGKEKSRVIEPIGPAAAPFDRLRNVTKQKLIRDAQNVLKYGIGSYSKEAEKFWGFEFPTSWTDIEVGQIGRPTAEGTLDIAIQKLVNTSKSQSTEANIALLDDLAQFIGAG